MPMGLTAEEVATRFNVSREAQDEFALKSQQKAAAALQKDVFKDEIVPVPLPDGSVFERDELPREGVPVADRGVPGGRDLRGGHQVHARVSDGQFLGVRRRVHQEQLRRGDAHRRPLRAELGPAAPMLQPRA